MELNINSPVYYSKVHGVDDEIYWLGREISKFVNGKKYSEIVKTIAITPVVMPIELREQGTFIKEIIQHKSKGELIIIYKHIDYNKYVNASIDEKKKLIVGNILKSVKSVKSKGEIDYAQFEQDILDLIGYTKEEIQGYC